MGQLDTSRRMRFVVMANSWGKGTRQEKCAVTCSQVPDEDEDQLLDYSTLQRAINYTKLIQKKRASKSDTRPFFLAAGFHRVS